MTDASMTGPAPSADLTSCDREPIHVPGAIQRFGFLLAVSPDWMVTRASANLGDWLGRAPADVLGLPLDAVLDPEAVHHLRGHLQALRGPDAVERAFAMRLLPDGTAFDVAIHVSGDAVVFEAEPASPERLSAGNLVRGMVGRLQHATCLESLCNEAARQVRAMTGFDRVMVYRFAPDGSGEVVAEAKRAALEPFLGLHYPASDIPRQARALYERNWLRLIADVDAVPVPVLPALDPGGKPLDLSLSTLRSVSPIHLEYLRNMGVAASMSVSILRGGKLWGLFACHHGEPRHLSLERRTGAELFGQVFSWVLDSREREAQAAAEARSREVHNRLLGALASGGTGLDGIVDFLDELSRLVPCDGIGLSLSGNLTLTGQTPSRAEFAALARFLNTAPSSEVFSTEELGRVHAPARDYAMRAAGVLAIPISRNPRDHLVFFRREVARSVTWAGNPEKPVQTGPNGVRLTPRKSFEAWHEEVRGRSLPWTAAELNVAEGLRVTLLEVILRLTSSAESERKVAQERQELLIAELNHRVRNILNLIRGVVAQSRESAADVEGFADVVGRRIQALARAHDQVTQGNWGPGSLRELVLLEAGAYLGSAADRVSVPDLDALVEPQAFTTLALVVHELVTNSAKYGALREPHGRVDVDWSFDPEGRLHLDWRESGGPPVRAPKRRGFGTAIIERSVPYELQGEAEVRYDLAGLAARFVVPSRHVRLAPSAPIRFPGERQPEPPASLDGTVLVVEDNMIIALEAEELLQGLGASGVDLAATVGEALRLTERATYRFALLDVSLGGETSIPVARKLLKAEVPFAFVTGYGESFRIPSELGDIPVVKKPFDTVALARAIAACLPPRRAAA